MEGEFSFPLGHEKYVTRFALDVNGKLREGVTVDKTRGRQAFESIVRRNVDPGLLEMEEGNIFRMRVYPLFGKQTKRVVVAYEEELKQTAEGLHYTLPLGYSDTLKHVEFTCTVAENDELPFFQYNPFAEGAEFSKEGNQSRFKYNVDEFLATGELEIVIPSQPTEQTFIQKGKYGNENMFYITTTPLVSVYPKKLPRKIVILLETSLSMSDRDFQKEENVLDAYFQQIKNCEVELHTIHCLSTRQQSMTIRDGNWNGLREAMQQTVYDGATSSGKIPLNEMNHFDEIWLFSDGFSTLDTTSLRYEKCTTPVIIFNSKQQANSGLLIDIAQKTGGRYIDLTSSSEQQVVDLLLHQPYRFIKANYNTKEIKDIYPKTPQNIEPNNSFSIAGKLRRKNASLQLHFGIGDSILHTQIINLNAVDSGDYGNLPERAWVQKQIDELILNFEKNKSRISDLGMKYNVITRNTSLIVLELVEDYALYNINPPEELQEAYNELLIDLEVEKEEQEAKHLEQVENSFKLYKRWWKETPEDRIKREEKEEEAERKREEKEERRREKEERKRYGYVRSRSYGQSKINQSGNLLQDSTVNVIRGVIKDDTGEPLIGACITVEGTTAGTCTDIDGNFSLTLPAGKRRVRITYIGYDGVDGIINKDRLEIILSEDYPILSEVVVMGYGTERSESSASNRLNASAERTDSGVSENEDATISLSDWLPEAAYLDTFKTISAHDYYPTYLAVRNDYKDMPAFYSDVSYLFEKQGLKDEAFLVLSNLLELDANNPQLLRVCARRLLQAGYTENAVLLYEKILSLREEEPQSYRDLGLAYEAAKRYQDAINMLLKITEKKWDDRFPQIEIVALQEINAIIAKAKREKIKVNTHRIPDALKANTPLDIRVVLNWDSDNTDMDLHVTDPNGETCYYSNRETKIAGYLTPDLTGGYGPEVFMLHNAISGKYIVEAKYYGSSQQTLLGPATIYLELYTDYATSNEKKEMIILKLEGHSDFVKIGEIEIRK